MPANLPPPYLKAEERYRQAQEPSERIAALEEMYRLLPKHKGTEKLQADLKTKLKETRDEQEAEKRAPKRQVKGTRIPRQGAGQILLVGGPNAGKSRILATLTKAKPEVAPYPFTTREVLPGMMPYEDVAVQLIDTPPITADVFDPTVANLARSADSLVLAVDGSDDDGPDAALAVLHALEKRKTRPAQTTGLAEDDLSVVEVRTLVLWTRSSDPGLPERREYFEQFLPRPLDSALWEAEDPATVEAVRERLYRMLDRIRVYTKAPGKPAEKTAPFTLHRGACVVDVAELVHRELVAKVKFAKIWRKGSAHFLTAGPDQEVLEGDLVELHIG